MSKHLIDDGYTRQGYLAEVERLHDNLAFTFRPMLAEEVDAVAEAAESKTAAEKSRIMRGVIAKQLQSWDVISGKGMTAEINIENVRRLPWRVVNQLYNMVAGLIPVDERPEKIAGDEPDIVADILESAETGIPYGITTEERERKNS